MSKKIKKISVLVTAAVIIGIFAGCSVFGKPQTSPEVSTSPVVETASPSPEATPGLNKVEIQKALEAEGDKVYDIAWSPDETAVAYIKQETDGAKIYVWSVDAAEANYISKAEDTTVGFTWAPDSKHFLVNVGHMGPGTITSTIIELSSLKAVGTVITSVSVSPPVWSSDGRFLAISTDDEATNAIEILVYAVASNTSVSVVKSTNAYGPYIVEKWVNDTVSYTEMTSADKRVESTLQFGE